MLLMTKTSNVNQKNTGVKIGEPNCLPPLTKAPKSNRPKLDATKKQSGVKK